MTKVARFDASAGDVYATKNIGPGSSYTIQAEYYLTAACLAAVHAATGSTGVWLGVGAPPFNDGPFADDEDLGPPFRFWAVQAPSPPSTVVTADAWHTTELDLTYAGSSTWDIVIKDNGSTLFADTGIGLGATDTDPLVLTIGGIQAAHASGEIYYIRNVLATWT